MRGNIGVRSPATLPQYFLQFQQRFGSHRDRLEPRVGSEEAHIEGLASVRHSNGTCSFPAFRFHEWLCERVSPPTPEAPTLLTRIAGRNVPRVSIEAEYE
jgi:hypothetical protein